MIAAVRSDLDCRARGLCGGPAARTLEGAPGRGRPPRHGRSEAIELLTLDLHPIFRNNRDIDLALREFVFRASRTGVDVVEIIPGKGSGQLKKRVIAFLAQKHIRKLYVRMETDATNSGRVLVHFS
ncbi:Smr/MutS family protein [Streptomyces polygonati]|uniref:Smr/MutS family protein n=1 Tax=Streptomyces polygonati TaxID=1617087 RepID=A0ABV8HGR1_9ACTN